MKWRDLLHAAPNYVLCTADWRCLRNIKFRAGLDLNFPEMNKGQCLEVSTRWLSVKCASSADCLSRALKISSLLIETCCKWCPKGMPQVSSFPPVFQYFLPPPLKSQINFKISLKFRYSLCFHAADVRSFLWLICLRHLLNRGALWVEEGSLSSTGIQLKFYL